MVITMYPEVECSQTEVRMSDKNTLFQQQTYGSTTTVDII